jgi:CRP-like cAMP-binding protein
MDDGSRCPGAVAGRCALCDAIRSDGTRLFRKSRPTWSAPLLWSVKAGSVFASHTTEAGARRACSIRGPGALIGLEGLMGAPAAFDYELRAEARCEVASLDAARELIERDASAARAAMLHAVGELSSQVFERRLLDGPSDVRLARFLLARDEDRSLSSWDDASMQDIACLLGMRPETLSRAIRRLEQRGVLADGRIPRVVDRDALRAVALAG